jgi:Na+-driven multidrug efflux pump
VFFFTPKGSYLKFVSADWRPRIGLWARMLKIGLPAGAEFALVGVYLFVVYTISRPFGAAAQAGFGIGLRIIQAGFMPVVALGFAVAPVAGQNFGARRPDRVREAFRSAVLAAAGVMLLFALLSHVAPTAMISLFSSDPQVAAVGDEYLRIVSWSYVASGVVFVCSSMFQAIGNTVPSLMASTIRIVLVVVPALWLSRVPGFQLRWIWYLAVAATIVQMFLCLYLLRQEFRSRLNSDPARDRERSPAPGEGTASANLEVPAAGLGAIEAAAAPADSD